MFMMIGIVLLIYGPYLLGALAMHHYFADPVTGKSMEVFLYFFPGIFIYAFGGYVLLTGDWVGGLKGLGSIVYGKRIR